MLRYSEEVTHVTGVKYLHRKIFGFYCCIFIQCTMMVFIYQPISSYCHLLEKLLKYRNYIILPRGIWSTISFLEINSQHAIACKNCSRGCQLRFRQITGMKVYMKEMQLRSISELLLKLASKIPSECNCFHAHALHHTAVLTASLLPIIHLTWDTQNLNLYTEMLQYLKYLILQYS